MTTSFDKTPPSVDIHRRFARLAVSWYAVDPVKVDRVLSAVRERHRAGEAVHILDALVQARILTAAQAENLRLGQAPTKMDVAAIERNALQENLAATTAPDVVNGNGAAGEDPTQVGPYRILRRLGQGGMGAVYLAFDGQGNRPVAVKVLSAEHAPNPKVLRRFQLEGQHGALLDHPNIVRSFDAGRDAVSGLYYIVLEYVTGSSAHELLESKGKLEVGDAVHIIVDIARALEHAHKSRVIHRDIKPANILLASSGLAKLSDLGLAKRQGEASNLTHASQGIGTPYYMPYEQAMNAKMADERSDIYALGATLYHLVTGEVPFTGESSLEIVEKKGVGSYPSARSLNPEVPETLEKILAEMMKRDPEDRYQTISEVIVDLERAQLAAPIPSFATLDSALKDPVMLQRITDPIEATQLDMRIKEALEDKTARPELWLVRFKDQTGKLCKSKETTAEILERLRSGTIPSDAEAAKTGQRSGGETFKKLAKWPAFAKSIAALRKPTAVPKAPPAQAPRSRWPMAGWIIIAVLGAAILSLLAVTAYLLMGS